MELKKAGKLICKCHIIIQYSLKNNLNVKWMK